MTAAARGRTALAAGVVLGVALRVAALWLAPRLGYLPDHLDQMAWSTWASARGATTMYDMRPELVPLLRVATDPRTQQPAAYLVLAPHAFNYPPFGAFVFWAKGTLWRALDRDVHTVPAPAVLRPLLEGEGLPTTLELRTVDTRLARAVDAAPSLVFEILLALGVARLARRVGGDGALAFALAFAAPGIVLDAALWGQSDAWIAAMLVWCLVWWLDGRWAAAGAAYGLALVTKPQAILFAPVLAYALLALRWRAGGSWARARQATLQFVPAALVVAAVVAAPFAVHDARAGAGAWRWFERGWIGTIASEEYAYTTMNAFNVWWLDLLRLRPWSAGEDWWGLLSSTATLLGASKDAVGRVLLAGALGVGAALCARRRGWDDSSCVAFAFLTLLSAFLLPTRVHERYVYYCLPFVTALAAGESAWRVPWAVLSLVATAEMLSHLWVAPTPGSFAVSGTAAAAAVAMLPWACAAVASRGPRL